MSSWMNEAAVQNHNGNGFTHIADPNAVAGTMMDPSAFMVGQPQFNPQAAAAAQQFANQQQQMLAMQNGQMRNGSPSFPNPAYQTNSVVPSKRPRPREDSMASSPRQNPSMLPTSRAETPQQAHFPNFAQGGMPQQTPGQPSPYPHLQPNASGNATPSPIMGNQMRPGAGPQRVATTSPHPFSPAAPNFGPQASPIPSEQTSTPQPNPYMQQGNFPPGFNPAFAGAPSPARPPSNPNAMSGQMMPQQIGQMPQQMGQMGAMGQMNQMNQMAQMQQMQQQMGQMPPQMLPQQMAQMQQQMAAQGRPTVEQQKLMYQMQLQRQIQQGNMQMAQQMQGQNMAQQRNMMVARQQMPNGQMPPNAMRPQQPIPPQQGGPPRPTNPDQFMKQLTNFMQSKQLPLNLSPSIEGRPVSLMHLFQVVQKFQGYRHVSQGNGWLQVSNTLGLHPQQLPMAPQQLKLIYEHNLLKFEDAVTQNRSKMAQQHQGALNSGGAQGTPTKMPTQGQMPPGQMMQPGQPPQMQPGQGPPPAKPTPQGAQQASVNGFSQPQLPPTPQQQQQQAISTPGHTRNSLSRRAQATPTQEDFPMPSPAQSKSGSMSMPGSARPEDQVMTADGATMPFPAPFSTDRKEYQPCSREVLTYGGVDLDSASKMGSELERVKPDVPVVGEMGNIDIQALTRSIQCGIHGEVRLALDTLAALTSLGQLQPMPPHLELDLTRCGDLVDCLVECAEDQIDVLAESTVEVSDEILIIAYEDVVRACRLENLAIRDIPVFGTPAYNLDRAVDRLVCITTILRNLSFSLCNQAILADESVIKLLCSAMRLLGTHNMLLRTNRNTLDFMKDVVILLSNVAHEVEIPGREQALCLVQFLLAFAPSPAPSLGSESLFFSPYEPALHPYLPPAVDALAKLLARDEPNRTHYQHLFAADAASTPPSELLTRTFALAISPIPDSQNDSRNPSLPHPVEVRKPYLMQGLLAADILASLAPGCESGVTKAWLSCGNSFAQNVLRLIRTLTAQFEGPAAPARGARTQQRKDTELVYIVVLATSMLRRLSEKTRDPSDPDSLPPNVVPSRESVVSALQMNSAEWTRDGFLQQLVACAAFDD